MSKLLPAILIATFTALPRAITAQTPQPPAAAALRARIDSLLPELQAAAMQKLHADSVARAKKIAEQREPLDTMVAAPYIVVAPHSTAGWMFRLVRQQLSVRSAILADLENAPRVTLLLEPKSGYIAFHQLGTEPRHHVITVAARKNATTDRVVGLGIDDAMRDLLPDSVRAWLQDGRLSFDNEFAETYREIGTSDAQLAAECLRGDVRACENSLELLTPLDSLKGHTLPQLQRLLGAGRSFSPRDAVADESVASNLPDSASVLKRVPQLRNEWLCYWRNTPIACVRVLNLRGGQVPSPIPAIGRASILYYALQAGGSGSLARARNTATPAAALAAAASKPLDAVVSAWRSEIEKHAPGPEQGMFASASASLLWAGVALVFAFRSTRRRVG